jgi:hypothetical protein
VAAIGIDEIAWKKGHKYLTLLYQINEGGRRRLFVALERTKESLAQFFRLLKADNGRRIEYVVSGNRTAGTYGLRVPGHSRNGCIPGAFGVPLLKVQESAFGALLGQCRAGQRQGTG